MNKTLKILLLILVAGLLIGGGTALYLFNMPHRNIHSTPADYSLHSHQIVEEYLNNSEAANEKYLASDGDSRVLEIRGRVHRVSEAYNGEQVILLKEANDKAGVQVRFSVETPAPTLAKGDLITIKGVIISGASYDEDLELYENVIIEKSELINKH